MHLLMQMSAIQYTSFFFPKKIWTEPFKQTPRVLRVQVHENIKQCFDFERLFLIRVPARGTHKQSLGSQASAEQVLLKIS